MDGIFLTKAGINITTNAYFLMYMADIVHVPLTVQIYIENCEFNNGGRLKTKLNDKRDDFTFPIVDLPFINITSVWTLHFITEISDFLGRAQLRTQKLLKQGYGRHHNPVNRYEISISIMTMDLLLFT